MPEVSARLGLCHKMVPQVPQRARQMLLLVHCWLPAVELNVISDQSYSKVHPELSMGTGPRIETEAEVVQGATNLHHQVTHPIFPQPNGVFDDPTPVDAADDMFDRDPSACHGPIERFLFRRQPAPLGLLNGARVLDTG